jgi:hypothetical protein
LTEATAIERCYREQGEKLWRALLLLGGDGEVASDAVAEAFAQAIRRGEGIDGGYRVYSDVFDLGGGESLPWDSSLLRTDEAGRPRGQRPEPAGSRGSLSERSVLPMVEIDLRWPRPRPTRGAVRCDNADRGLTDLFVVGPTPSGRSRPL